MMIQKICILLALVCLSTSKLYQVVSLFRHGARYHLSDRLDGNTTRSQWGEITKVGMRQHQNLGKTLRKQYIDNLHFLSNTYNKKEIQVLSTSVNRTIQSALSQIYGLYPPGNGPKMQKTQTKYHLPPFTNASDIEQQTYAFPHGHQQIQVTADKSETIFMEHCPQLSTLQSNNYKRLAPVVDEMNVTYYPFLQKVIKAFNLQVSNTTFYDLYADFGNLAVDKYLSRPLPDGFTQDDYKNMEHIHFWVMSVRYGDIVAKLKSTRFMKKVLSEFNNRVKSPKGYPRKWSFLSAHDTDVLPMFINMNITSYQCIEQLYRKGKTSALNCQPHANYASSLIFELHSDNQVDFYVKVRAQGQYMNLCQKEDKQCSYGQFSARVINSYVTDVQKTCGIIKGLSTGGFDAKIDADLIEENHIIQ